METEFAPIEIGKMTRMQKLAALLIILGPEAAAQMLKHLDEREVEAVSVEMAKINLVDQDLQREILRDFTDVAVQASASIVGGASFAKTALEKSVGLFRASDIMGRILPTPTPVGAMDQIVGLEPRQLFNLLKLEQPQTIALVISYLSPERGSQLLELFSTDLRNDVIERLATLAPTPVEVVERMAEVLSRKIGVKSTRGMSQTGGLKITADVLNSLDKNLTQSMLLELEKRNPELTMAIRQKMFTFEELSLLDVSSLQKVLREVDLRDLAIALKGASAKVKAAIMSAMSRRAAETLNEEISFLGVLKKKEIEAAQMRVIDSLRQLETEGEIDLASFTSRSRDEVLA